MSDPELSDGKIGVLRLLKQALDDTEDSGRDLWQFAIRKAALLASGGTVNDLRWLISRRLIDQAAEVTKRGDRDRTFSKLTSLYLPEDACFILTHGGRVYVERMQVDRAVDRARSEPHGVQPRRTRAQRSRGRHKQRDTGSPRPCSPIDLYSQAPEWHPIEGELHFRGDLLRRRGRKIARLEELLLGAFANAKWARSIANPFCGDEGHAQLVEAVRRLNNSLLATTLGFHVCSSGTIVSWEDRGAAPTNLAPVYLNLQAPNKPSIKHCSNNPTNVPLETNMPASVRRALRR